MASKRKLCIVTGTRAEYGLFIPLLREIKKDGDYQLQLVATGMHLSPEFGATYHRIEEDGFTIDYKVEMLLSGDTASSVVKSMGLALIGFSDAFQQLRPDLLVLIGDRYEILAAAQAAMILKIPIAHIAGGDTTEGAFDEAIRHSITKMSQVHFVTNELSYQRVRQLGENPDYVFHVGSLGIDRIRMLQALSRDQLEEKLSFQFCSRNLLITFHPATLDDQQPGKQFWELLAALYNLGPDTGLIFTKPNSDPGGREISALIDAFVIRHSNGAAYIDLGDSVYLSLMKQVDAVVGNSSGGIYEAPSFQKPTVNIGDRQKGRLMASSVICCPPERGAIEKAVEEAFAMDCTSVENPYGNGYSAEKIMDVLRAIPDYQHLLIKRFHMVPIHSPR